VELPGASGDHGIAPVTVTVPASTSCPVETRGGKSVTLFENPRWLVTTVAMLWGRSRVQGWPDIQPIDTSVTFVNPGAGGHDTPFEIAIRGVNGTDLYSLECHNGNYDDESLIDFADDFQCGLFTHGADSASETNFNLLASDTPDEQSSDWFNRGRMLAQQLRGECAQYAEYGAVRHFTLRRMRVTFAFTDVRWIAPTPQVGLERFTFRVTAAVDDSAQTAQAEQVQVKRPPPVCQPTA
jgi:hypothetical protein